MKLRPEKFLSCIFICLLVLFLSLVFFQLGRRGLDKMKDPEDSLPSIEIDWTKLYPFESESDFDSESAQITQFTQGGGVLRRIYNYLKARIDEHTSKKLIFYSGIIENAKRYEKFIKWDIAYMGDYNPVVRLSDGYLTVFTPSRDVTGDALSTLELANFCESLDIKFLYINLPNKICVSQDKDVSGILDYCNQNTDKFLNMLKDFGVKYCDLRKNLHESGLNHHEAFFRTDHHWKPETGLWAAREILKFLRNNYNWPVTPEILNPENFDIVIYKDRMFGSQGVKVTLLQDKPEDFSMIYPKFDTLIHFEIPNLLINKSGDFNITYNDRSLRKRNYNYYVSNPYSIYNHGQGAFTRVTNYLTSCDKKILVITDSFGTVFNPFFALGVKQLCEIDLRYFTGSVKSIIKSERPDMVIITYYTTQPGISSIYKNNKLFDFR
ncbi:MAG: hypothetical protein IJS99_09610 [Synergistaceae bacterium]|nr:hypothetical protein [Synergistaceae bacterium]